MFSSSCVMEAQCSNNWSHWSQTVLEIFISLATAWKYQVGIRLKLSPDISPNCIFKVKYTVYWEVLLAWKQIRQNSSWAKGFFWKQPDSGTHYTTIWLVQSKMTRWRLGTTLFIPSIWLITEFGRCGEVSWRLTWKRKTLSSCYLISLQQWDERLWHCSDARHACWQLYSSPPFQVWSTTSR